MMTWCASRFCWLCLRACCAESSAGLLPCVRRGQEQTDALRGHEIDRVGRACGLKQEQKICK